MPNDEPALSNRAGGELIQTTPVLERVPAAQPNPLVVAHSLLRGRYALAIGLAILGAVIGGPIGYHLMEPEYRSVGVIQIEPRGQRLVYQIEETGMMPMFDFHISSQLALISSRRLIEDAMEQPAWKLIRGGSESNTFAEFTRNLRATNPRGTPFIEISFSDHSPKVAAIAVNSVLEVFERIYNENKAKKEQAKLSQLETLQSNLTTSLTLKTDQIQQIAGEFGPNALEQDLEDHLRQTSEARGQLEVVRMQMELAGLGSVSADGKAAPSTQPSLQVLDVLIRDDPRLKWLRQVRDGDDLRLRHLQTRYGDEHPQIAELTASVRTTDALIRERIEALRQDASLMPVGAFAPAGAEGMTLAELKAREAALLKLFEQRSAATASLASRSRDIEKLRFEAQEISDQLKDTKVRLSQLRTEHDKAGELTVISTGEEPAVPDKDRRKALGAVGALGMAGVGVGFVLMLGFFDRRLRHVDRARSHLPQIERLLGVLPQLPDDLSDLHEASECAFCVHHIRAMLQIHQRSSGRKVFAITSPSPGDGKTSVTIAVGMSLASSGGNTLLIDCDFDGGGLSARLFAPPAGSGPETKRAAERSPGIVDVLRGMPLDKAVVPTGYPNLWRLSLGAAPGAYVGQVSPGQLRRILVPLAARFDTVLVDCGPVLGSIEAAITAAEVDSVILVVSRDSDRVAAEHAAELLVAAGSAVEGIVFNRARPADVARSAYHSSGSLRSARLSRRSVGDPAAPPSDSTRSEPSGSIS